MASKNRRTPNQRAAPGRFVKGDAYRHGNLREALVAEAVRLMEERPDSSFTLREAAQRIRVSHTAAYRHFQNKGALLAELAQRGFILLAAGLSAAVRDAESANELVRLQAQAYLQTALENPALFRCMFGPKTFGPEEQAAVDAHCQVCYDLLLVAAKRLRAECPDMKASVEDVGLLLWSSIHGLSSLALDGHLCEAKKPSLKDYNEMANRVIDLLLNRLARRA